MPWLEKRGGTYRVKYRFGGKVRQAALKTGDETAAKTALAKFEETLSDVLRGRLTIPDGADVGLFLLSDGKLDKRPVHVDAPLALTVSELFAHYQTHLTPGAKEANTRKYEGVHIRHLTRLLGGKTAVEKIGTAQVQEYVDRRAAEKYRTKPIKPQTVRKEVATLSTMWNWAHRRGRAPVPCSTKDVRFPKGGERERFRTYDEVAEIVARGGLSKERVIRSVSKGIASSSAHFRRCASSDALNAAAEPNFFAMAVPRLTPLLRGHCAVAKQPRELRPSASGFGELRSAHEPACDRVLHGLCELLSTHAASRGVKQRAKRRRDAESFALFDVFGCERRLVQNASLWSGLSKRAGHGQVNAVGEEFGQVVEDEGRLVRDDGLGLVLLVSTPERKSDEVVVFGRRDRRQAVEAVFDPLEVPSRLVVVEVLVAVTCFYGLLCGEIATMVVGDCREQTG